MATTVTSDAEFKTYVEGLTAFTTDTVYMNDDSKYWTFTRENNGKINAMCVTSNNVELWMYDGTDWVINRVPSVVNNLTSTSTSDALSANQGKILKEEINDKLHYQDINVSGTTDSRGLYKLIELSNQVPLIVLNSGELIQFTNGSAYGYAPYLRLCNFDGTVKANTSFSFTIRCLASG